MVCDFRARQGAPGSTADAHDLDERRTVPYLREMDFRLTPEQEEFRRAVARFVAAEVAPVAHDIDEAGEFPRALFRRLGEQGYLALRYPETYGGTDADS